MHMICKGQIQGAEKEDIQDQVKFIAQIFESLHKPLPTQQALDVLKKFCNRTLFAISMQCLGGVGWAMPT